MSDAPKKKGSSGPSPLLVVGTALVLIALCFAVPSIGEWSAPEEEGETESQPRTVVTRDSSRAVSSNWQRTTLPSSDADWPSWIEIPVGHSIRFCDPVRDPGCSATDFSGVRFDAQCRSLVDGNPRDQMSGECTWTDAYRARAKGSEPITLLYRFERQM